MKFTRDWNTIKDLPEVQHKITYQEALDLAAKFEALSTGKIQIWAEFFYDKTILQACFELTGDNPKMLMFVLNALWPDRFQLLMNN